MRLLLHACGDVVQLLLLVVSPAESSCEIVTQYSRNGFPIQASSGIITARIILMEHFMAIDPLYCTSDQLRTDDWLRVTSWAGSVTFRFPAAIARICVQVPRGSQPISTVVQILNILLLKFEFGEEVSSSGLKIGNPRDSSPTQN